MPLRNANPLVHVPKGLSDAAEGTNIFRGAMTNLSNLIPAPETTSCWVPRPASVIATSFASFTSPGFVSAALIVGDIMYGMMATGRNAGHDEPFSYNLLTGTFNTVANVTSANTPTSPATTGDWSPPIMAVVGTRIIVTHPGFPGGATKFGWLDLSNFTSSTITGNTNSNTTINSLSSNVLQAGWAVGMKITGTNIPANTYIVSIATNGLSCVISNAATGTTAGVTFTVTGGSTSAPLWGAGDTNINNLASTPVGVAQMNGRAFFLVGAGVVISDSLIPCQVTNASQALTFNNGVNATAIGALPLSSPVTGGIIQSIIVFQGVTAIQQITGDFATNNMALNILKGNTGTLAPLSVVPTIQGLMFVSPDGLRVINFNAQVSDPIGDNGQGISQAFAYAVYPSRIVAAAGSNVLRISTQNSLKANSPYEEYWYDFSLKIWHGPHTFPASQIQPWKNTFIIAPANVTGSLWQTDPVPSAASSYTENSVALTWAFNTIMLPDNEQMSMNAVIESTISLTFPTGQATVTAVASDEQGTVLAQTTINSNIGVASLWGGANWGAFLWGGGATKLAQHRIPWPQPVVFKQMALSFTGVSAPGVKVSNIYLKYQKLGYLIEVT